MKRILNLMIILVCMVWMTACGADNAVDFDASAQEESKKIHNDISAENIQHVNISGDARSVIIQQSADEYFAFYNKDLNPDHTYQVRCDENDGTIDIHISMENAGDDNNILGSVVVDIPQKEFENIDVTGDFRQISLYTMNSDVLIHDCSAFVNLELESAYLTHNITLSGSKENAFSGVSVYLDAVPDNAGMELSLLPGGTINDLEDMLKENELEAGSRHPMISINNTWQVNLYKNE